MGCTESFSPLTAVSCHRAASLLAFAGQVCGGLTHSLSLSRHNWGPVAFPGSPASPHVLHSAWPNRSPSSLHCVATSLLIMGKLPLAVLGQVNTSRLHPCPTQQIKTWGVTHTLLLCPTTKLYPCLCIRHPSGWLLPRVPSKRQSKSPWAPSAPVK